MQAVALDLGLVMGTDGAFHCLSWSSLNGRDFWATLKALELSTAWRPFLGKGSHAGKDVVCAVENWSKFVLAGAGHVTYAAHRSCANSAWTSCIDPLRE